MSASMALKNCDMVLAVAFTCRRRNSCEGLLHWSWSSPAGDSLHRRWLWGRCTHMLRASAFNSSRWSSTTISTVSVTPGAHFDEGRVDGVVAFDSAGHLVGEESNSASVGSSVNTIWR